MKKHLFPILITATLLASNAQAVVITSLFGTGLDASGNPLAAGASDPHYAVVLPSGQAEVLNSPPASYFANDANSQWIWENADGQPTDVTRTFRTTFDLTGLDTTTAVINGLWGADNTGIDILINGSSTGESLPGSELSNFTSLHAFTINSGFVTGINTLDFVIQDVGIVSGFRAQLDGTADAVTDSVPEGGATLAMLGLALVGIARFARKAA